MINPSPYCGPSFAGLKIGLFGGSFNPAHAGHLDVSLYALKKLGLDQVWWLVAPQNPLKKDNEMKPLDVRVATARALVRAHARIVVTPMEAQLGTRYTIDTIKALQKRMPRTHFVWLMGGDNLLDITRWRRWPALFEAVPIAVFQRPGYAAGRSRGAAATRFAAYWQKQGQEKNLAHENSPAWCVLNNRKNPLSATVLRQSLHKGDQDS